jgi:hypothetical protein
MTAARLFRQPDKWRYGKSRAMDALTAFGLFAVTAMLQGAWPFGLVEAIWCAVAGRRWWLKQA